MNLMIPTPGWSRADGREAVVRCHQGPVDDCHYTRVVVVQIWYWGVPGASLGSFESWDVYINTLIEDVSRG